MVLARRTMTVPRSLAMLLPALLLLTAACGDDDPTEPGAAPTEEGVYTLQSANGQNLPVTITGTTLGTVVIQNGTMSLTRGTPQSTYVALVRGTAGGAPTSDLVTDDGTYTVAGGTITFTSSSGLTYAAAATTTQLTVAVPGIAIGTTGTLTLVLRKN